MIAGTVNSLASASLTERVEGRLPQISAKLQTSRAFVVTSSICDAAQTADIDAFTAAYGVPLIDAALERRLVVEEMACDPSPD